MTAAAAIMPEARYPALFGRALPELPGARHAPIRRWREQRLDRFLAAGFPGPKSEAWKYTSLGRIARAPFVLAPAVALAPAALAPYLLDEPGGTRLVFVNGRFDPALSAVPSAARGVTVGPLGVSLDQGDAAVLEVLADADQDRSLTALNDAFAADGAVIRVADGSAPRAPVHLLFVSVGGEAPGLINCRNVVIVGEQARLQVIETHVMVGAAQNLTNLISDVIVGRGAELRHERLQIGATAEALVGRTRYDVSADARLTQTVVSFGGGLVRNETYAAVRGAGSETALNGLYFARGREHVDNQILVDHAAPGSVSDQFYKGILADHAHAVFAGKIVVRRDAQKTNAYQSNNNLLLSADAEVDTKPELEIFADDVKCSHGATAGEPDERELFYLRSRGLDLATARSVLTFAFAGAVLERIAHPTIARQARHGLLARLPGGAALGEMA
jgi:Fe-S cluster assembly protein SufD